MPPITSAVGAQYQFRQLGEHTLGVTNQARKIYKLNPEYYGNLLRKVPGVGQKNERAHIQLIANAITQAEYDNNQGWGSWLLGSSLKLPFPNRWSTLPEVSK